MVDANLEHDLDEFGASLQAVDMDEVERRAMRQSMEDLRDMVLDEIRAEGLFGFQTPGNRGEGPALATEAAWNIENLGEGTWVLRTDERVSDRAFYLEFGTDPHAAENTTSGSRYKFTGPNGNTIYPKEVDGVQEYAFWRTALQRFEKENVLSTNVEEEFEQELREALQG